MGEDAFKRDMKEFVKNKKMLRKFEESMNGQCDTFAHGTLDHLARTLDRVYGGKRFMDAACK